MASVMIRCRISIDPKAFNTRDGHVLTKEISMTHHHDHEHDHEHDHDHDHGPHHHHHDSVETLTLDQKMIKLVAHWVRHNDDHVANYRDWAKKAADAGRADVAAELEEAARVTGETTAIFKRALTLLEAHAPE